MTQQNHAVTARTFLLTTSEAVAGSPAKNPHRRFEQMFKYTCDQNQPFQGSTEQLSANIIEQTEPQSVQYPNDAVIAPLMSLQFNQELFLANQTKVTKRRQRRG